MVNELFIEDYNYNLPEERIAKYPLASRDSSKQLMYKDGKLEEHIFNSLPDYLPENSIMVFNDTKVVPARLHFQRESGAHIEIFCLEPSEPSDYNISFASRQNCCWKCIIGNSKRWKDDVLHVYNPENREDISAINFRATLLSKDGQVGIVRFDWDGGECFSNILDLCGSIPIPPYLNRNTELIDLDRYQTLYARKKGSVAAPTAGLHFTDDVMKRISAKGIALEKVCLHVGAGTFLPVKSSKVAEHHMHREPFVVSLGFLESLRDYKGKVIAVGTTSVRTLESLYYVGVSIIETGQPQEVEQWVPYEREYAYSTTESLDAIISYLKANALDELKVGTRIIIVPGFKFRVVDILVTNFHQPESTLLLLVSAFVKGDWRCMYDYALEHDFRFLSYGDSCLIFRN